MTDATQGIELLRASLNVAEAMAPFGAPIWMLGGVIAYKGTAAGSENIQGFGLLLVAAGTMMNFVFMNMTMPVEAAPLIGIMTTGMIAGPAMLCGATAARVERRGDRRAF